MKMKRLFAMTAMILAAPLAQAQESGAYLGGGLGRSRIGFDNGSFASNSPNISDSKNASKTGYSAFAGYDIDKHWAVEGGYTRLGSFKYNYTGTNALAGAAGQATYGAGAWWLAGKGTVAVSDKFDLYGKLGLSENRARDNESTNSAAMNAVLGTPVTRNTNKAAMLIGAGAEYHINKKVGVRLEYDDYGKFGTAGAQNLARLSQWTAEVAYHF